MIDFENFIHSFIYLVTLEAKNRNRIRFGIHTIVWVYIYQNKNSIFITKEFYVIRIIYEH